jgi:anaerobic magnesium-protoporphyrin IX monomethyl ester cyclase
MKVILISPPNIFDNSEAVPSLTLATLSGILENNNIEYTCIDGNFIAKNDNSISSKHDIISEILQKVVNYNPDIICISIWGVCIPFAIKLTDLIKQKSKETPIIIGGIKDIDTAQHIVKLTTNVECIFIGEAENRFCDILYSIINKKPINIIEEDIKPEISRLNKKLQNKNTNSYPNYENFNISKIHSLFIELSRGCIYRCIFCGLHNTEYRRLTPEQSIEQIHYLLKKYNVKYLNFADNFIPMKGKWITEFLDLIISFKINFNWSCLIRADNIDKELIPRLAKTGCVGVFIGIESVNQDTLSYMNKCTNPDKYISELEENIHTFCQNKINVKLSTIVGFPNETKEDMWDTARFVKKMIRKGYDAYTGPLVVYPGSELWKKHKNGEIKLNQIKNKKVKRNNSGMYLSDFNLSPIISPNDFIPENSYMKQEVLEDEICKIIEFLE